MPNRRHRRFFTGLLAGTLVAGAVVLLVGCNHAATRIADASELEDMAGQRVWVEGRPFFDKSAQFITDAESQTTFRVDNAGRIPASVEYARVAGTLALNWDDGPALKNASWSEAVAPAPAAVLSSADQLESLAGKRVTVEGLLKVSAKGASLLGPDFEIALLHVHDDCPITAGHAAFALVTGLLEDSGNGWQVMRSAQFDRLTAAAGTPPEGAPARLRLRGLVGRQVTIEGFAVNSAEGAAIDPRTASPILVDGLASWPDEVVARHVVVTGKLAASGSTAAPVYTLEHATWKAASALGDAKPSTP